jgi:hypothetical protein
MRGKLYLSLLIGVLLCLAGWTAHAQVQRSAPARQAWEYKTINFGGSAGNWTAWFEDGNALPPPINGTAKRAELGAQGWELVAVATTVDSVNGDAYTNTMQQFYKRPR